MIPVSQAISLIEQNVRSLGIEEVPIDSSVGRVLAEDIVADMDLPPFDRSQMDGFAVRADDVANAPVELRLVGESAAGHGWHDEMKAGEAVRIMTGARVPIGADTVQKVELTSEYSFGSEPAQQTNGTVTINESIAARKNIVRQGDEVKKGETIFRSGDRINERMIATLAAFGYANVGVAKSPRVSIFTTGSEVVDIDQTPGVDQIRNSNSAMLSALVATAGASPSLLPSAVDDLESIKQVIADAARNSDVIVITGGVSVGKYDLTKKALIELGAEIFFDRVRLKPGKPAVFARLGKTLVFGLPGNPVSAAVTFYIFVRKALLLMQNARETDLKKGVAIAGGILKAAKERDTYLPAKLSIDKSARLTVTPVKWIGSSDFIGFGKADVLAFIPGSQKINEGEITEFLFL
jgi:molybdopterin molybdotransferase